MNKLNMPMDGRHLRIVPPWPSQITVDDRIGQTLAMLIGLSYNEAVPLHASPSGVLYQATPRIAEIEHWTATGANQTFTGSDVVSTSVLCLAHPDNSGRVWVRPRIAATVNNAVPLEGGAIAGFTVENLNWLHALIVVSGDTLIVAYSQ